MRMGERETISPFIDKKAKAYEEADFTKEQKFLYFSKVSLITKEI